jgi:thymidine kinase
MNETPKFIIYCGPMFSSKTTNMLLKLERFELQGKKVHVFKPDLDNRYSKIDIVTHSGWKREATVINCANDILKHMKTNPSNVVAIDEAFMLKDCSKVLTWLYKNGVTIVVSTLNLNYKCVPFPEIEKLLPWATDIIKCTSVCSICGNDAHYSYRNSRDDNDIVIGGGELYEPRCFFHHPFINELDK